MLKLTKRQEEFVKNQNSVKKPVMNPYHPVYNKDFYKSKVEKTKRNHYQNKIRNIF